MGSYINIITGAKKKYANELLEELQEPVFYYVKRKRVAVPLLKKIPFLSRFVKNAGGVGNEAMQLGGSLDTLHESAHTVMKASSGLQFGVVSFAAVDFLLIPIVYLSAYLLNQKVPFTVNNNVRLVYSGIVLALTLTAIFVPGAAPVIALVSAGLTLGVSAFFLGKALRERYLLGKERKALKREIAHEEEEMQRIQNEAQQLQSDLNTTDDEQQLQEIYAQISMLQERYQTQIKILQELKEKESDLNQKIKKLNFVRILDKGIAASFAAIAIVGCVVSIFFPPAGFIILASVSLASLAYLAARIFTPIVRAIGTWALNKFRTPEKSNVVEEPPEHPLEHPLHQAFDKSDAMVIAELIHEEDNLVTSIVSADVDESTESMLIGFLGTKEAVIANVTTITQEIKNTTDEEVIHPPDSITDVILDTLVAEKERAPIKLEKADKDDKKGTDEELEDEEGVFEKEEEYEEENEGNGVEQKFPPQK